MLAYITKKIEITEGREPVGVVDQTSGIRFRFEIKELRQLGLDGFNVGLDLIFGEQIALRSLAAWVTDGAGGATSHSNGMMSLILKATKREQRHDVADMKRVRGRIEACVEGDGLCGETFGQGQDVGTRLRHGGEVGDEAAELEIVENVHGAREGTRTVGEPFQARNRLPRPARAKRLMIAACCEPGRLAYFDFSQKRAMPSAHMAVLLADS
jgi:hypothetical protein